MSLHAPSRRELLLASGTLFAWAYVPKLALAQGRDPRLELMCGEMRQILAKGDIGLGLLRRQFVQIDGHERASFALRRNLGITRI